MEPRCGQPANSRRRFLLGTLGLGLTAPLAAALGPTGACGEITPMAHANGGAITRPVPRTKELLPAVGLGTFMTFDLLPGEPREHLREVVRRYWEGGARVIDTSPLYGTGETNVGDFAASLGISDEIFITNKVWSTGEYLGDPSHAARSLEQSLHRLWRQRIDVMQCHSLVNIDALLPLLQLWKKEQRIRYVGATHHEVAYYDALATWVERGALDFVQVRYSIATRKAEERILPAALDQGTGVLVNMPLEKARLHKLVEGRPLPDFARELGADSWSQFFLKWILGHPAVTCVLPSTSNPNHASENIAALRGPLPDQALRDRMLRHMETIPGFAQLEQMAWYPDKRYAGTIARAQTAVRSQLGP